jgi:hypothetical protein
MKEIDMRPAKPIGHDTRLQDALNKTMGWNPLHVENKVARFRCQNCGTLLGIASRDMAGEFENKCPVCGLTHLFNRKPRGLPAEQIAAIEQMFPSGNRE